MATIGAENKKVPGAENASLTIGSDLYAFAQDYNYDEGYEEIKDPVGGTTAPVLTPGTFDGNFESEMVYTSDLPTNFLTLTNGDLPVKTIALALKDVQSSPVTKTHTISNAKIFRQGIRKQRHNLVRYHLRAVYPQPVVVT